MDHEDRFASFFQTVTGHEPFEWQAAMAAQLAGGDVPGRIDVPTGFGKTSVVHCWAYALSSGGNVARRLAFVVDRRLVVDATFNDANELADVLGRALNNDEPSSEVTGIAHGLKALHADPDLAPLVVVRMRGGMSWESRWLPRPDQAAVIVGTVDQFGSRLLFRGYGASDRMRPIDAALVGTDTWLVVDEAHIAEPLLGTARSVSDHQGMAERDVGRSLVVTEMSATSPSNIGGFEADAERQASSVKFHAAAVVARRRLDADKPTALVDLEDLASGTRKSWRRNSQKLGAALGDVAYHSTDGAEVVGVIANTIGTARAAYERLSSLATGERNDVVLMIGRCRAFERDRLIERDLASAMVQAERAGDGRRRFVVATQTIEVGANLDFDALVTECAPMSSLVQRFGRVNRTGDRVARPSWIVRAGFAHGADDADPVYGAATAATWDHMLARGADAIGAATKDVRAPIVAPVETVLSFGLRAARALTIGQPDEVRSPRRFTPRLLGAHLERWVSTSPVPVPDQPVAPFLHGADATGPPDVEVAWRTSPPEAIGDGAGHYSVAAWRDWLAISPPTSWEFVAVPIWEARALVAGRAADTATSDLESAVAPLDEEFESEATSAIGVIYRGPGQEPELLVRPASIRPGDRIILLPEVGGHDRWGWTGHRRADGEPVVADIADLTPASRRQVIRVAALPSGHAPPAASVSQADLGRARDELDIDATFEVATQALVQMLNIDVDTEGGGRSSEGWISERWGARDEWEGRYERLGGVGPSGSETTAYTLVLRRRSRQIADLARMSDEDVTSTSLGTARLGLLQHGDEVGELAAKFARQLGLDSDLVRAVELAGKWHDLGKADPRFQVMLYDGEVLDAQAGPLIAKSGRDLRDPVARAAQGLAGLPAGFRHEAVSARLVRGYPDGQSGDEPHVDRELVHHLVASHHGYARPLMPAVDDPGAEAIALKLEGRTFEAVPAPQIDWDHAAVFERLNQRYGWWGLALLESLVRLADMRCSERGVR